MMILRYSRLHRCVQYESASLTKPLKHLLTRQARYRVSGATNSSFEDVLYI
jgi:hypothetical protein